MPIQRTLFRYILCVVRLDVASVEGSEMCLGAHRAFHARVLIRAALTLVGIFMVGMRSND